MSVRLIPRENPEALAALSKGLSNMNTGNTDGARIGAHMVQAAVEKMPVFEALRGDLTQYFARLTASSPDVAANEAECQKRLAAMRVELDQAREAVKAAEEAASAASASAHEAAEAIEDSQESGAGQDSEAEQRQKEAAKAFAREAEAKAEAAAKAASDAAEDIDDASRSTVAAAGTLQKGPIVGSWQKIMAEIVNENVTKDNPDPRTIAGLSFDATVVTPYTDSPNGVVLKTFGVMRAGRVLAFVDDRAAANADYAGFEQMRTMWHGFETNIAVPGRAKKSVTGTPYATGQGFDFVLTVMVYIDYVITYSFVNGVDPTSILQKDAEFLEATSIDADAGTGVPLDEYFAGFTNTESAGKHFTVKK